MSLRVTSIFKVYKIGLDYNIPDLLSLSSLTFWVAAPSPWLTFHFEKPDVKTKVTAAFQPLYFADCFMQVPEQISLVEPHCSYEKFGVRAASRFSWIDLKVPGSLCILVFHRLSFFHSLFAWNTLNLLQPPFSLCSSGSHNDSLRTQGKYFQCKILTMHQ